MLEITNLSAGYGPATVLHGVTLTVPEGEVVTLVGRNGAGKTTLLRVIMGLLPAANGNITLGTRVLDGLAPMHRARLGLGFVPDDRGIYASLTVEEHLQLPKPTGPGAWTAQQIYEAFPRLSARRSSPGTKLSGGEQQMLSLARVLRMGSTLLLCDEPTEGLAPVVVDEIAALFHRIKQQGTAILLVEQNLHFATSVADRHYLIAEGQIQRCMTNEEVKGHETELLEYLGV